MKRYIFILFLGCIVNMQADMQKSLIKLDDIKQINIKSSLNETKQEDSIDNKSGITQYLFTVKFPSNIKKMPVLCGYYKGKPLDFDKDFCIISQKEPVNQFTLVITDQISFPHESNIKHLERIEGNPCNLYYITKKDDITWCVEEQNIKDLPLKLPNDSIILLINPEYVEFIDNNIRSVSNKKNIIDLPCVVIKSNISQQELLTASISSLLASLDVKSIHAQVEKALKQEGAVISELKVSRSN